MNARVGLSNPYPADKVAISWRGPANQIVVSCVPVPDDDATIPAAHTDETAGDDVIVPEDRNASLNCEQAPQNAVRRRDRYFYVRELYLQHGIVAEREGVWLGSGLGVAIDRYRLRNN